MGWQPDGDPARQSLRDLRQRRPVVPETHRQRPSKDSTAVDMATAHRPRTCESVKQAPWTGLAGAGHVSTPGSGEATATS